MLIPSLQKKMETIKIFTFISLFALPTERKLLFTCTKYRESSVATKNQCKRINLFTDIKYKNPHNKLPSSHIRLFTDRKEYFSFTRCDKGGKRLHVNSQLPFPLTTLCFMQAYLYLLQPQTQATKRKLNVCSGSLKFCTGFASSFSLLKKQVQLTQRKDKRE